MNTAYFNPSIAGQLELATSVVPRIAPSIKMDDVAFSGDTSTVDFDYEVTASPAPFTVQLFQSPTPTFDPSTAVEVQDPGTYELAMQTVTPSGPNTPMTQGVFTFTQPLVGDPTRPYLIAVADPTHQLQGVDETNNSSDVLFPTVQLVMPQRRLTLMQGLTFQTTISLGPDADSYSLQVQPQTTQASSNWNTVATTDQGSVTQRLAGYFNVRATATINGVVFYSRTETVEVQFPDFTMIVSDPVVQAAMNAAWTDTLAFAEAENQNGSVLTDREEGFWIQLNTSTGQYIIDPTFYGTPSEALPGVTVGITPQQIGPKPTDVFLSTDQGDAAIYTIAIFHTHTPMAFIPILLNPDGSPVITRKVGSSTDDDQFAQENNVVGIVYDYDSPTGIIPAGWGLDQQASLYEAGLFRRPTPPRS